MPSGISGSQSIDLPRLEKNHRLKPRLTSDINKDFHTNFDAKMCYVEDVYHTRCGHWADKPRLYHSCAAANVTGPQKQCFNEKKCGSVQDDSYCQRCIIHADMTAGRNAGACMTVVQNEQRSEEVQRPTAQPTGLFQRKLEDKRSCL